MTTIGATAMTLADWAKRADPEGKIDLIVEILGKTNQILDDMLWVEGNLPTGHRTTVRAGLPATAWRSLNYGVPKSKSTTVQVTDACGMLETYSEIDKDLADLNGNTAQFRMSEDKAFLEAMNRSFATTLFYGDTNTDPEKFLGLTPRFNDATNADNKSQVIKAGGSGADNTSLWVVTWADSTVHGIFPKGKKSGLMHKDMGEVTLEDAGGGLYQGYRSHYKWDCGLTVRDWRYVARVANISVGALGDAGASGYDGPDLVNLLIEAINAVENPSVGRTAIYCNKTVKTALDKLAASKANVNLTIETFGGRPTTAFWGYPVRRCDALVSTEALVA